MPLAGVIGHSLEVDDDSCFIAYDPGVMPRSQQGNITRPAIKLAAIIHHDADDSGHVILKMRSFAAFRLRNGTVTLPTDECNKSPVTSLFTPR
jgi:hypothetical protein